MKIVKFFIFKISLFFWMYGIALAGKYADEKKSDHSMEYFFNSIPIYYFSDDEAKIFDDWSADFFKPYLHEKDKTVLVNTFAWEMYCEWNEGLEKDKDFPFLSPGPFLECALLEEKSFLKKWSPVKKNLKLLLKSLLKKTGLTQKALFLKLDMPRMGMDYLFLQEKEEKQLLVEKLKQHFNVHYDFDADQVTWLYSSFNFFDKSFEKDYILENILTLKKEDEGYEDDKIFNYLCVERFEQFIKKEADRAFEQFVKKEEMYAEDDFCFSIESLEKNLSCKVLKSMAFSKTLLSSFVQQKVMRDAKSGFMDTVDKKKGFFKKQLKVLFQSLLDQTGLSQSTLSYIVGFEKKEALQQILLGQGHIGPKQVQRLKKHFQILFDLKTGQYQYLQPLERYSLKKGGKEKKSQQKITLKQEKCKASIILFQSLLKKTGLNQRQLSLHLEMAPSSVSGILKQNHSIGFKMVAQLKKHFKIFYDLTKDQYEYCDNPDESFEKDCLFVNEL